MTDKKVAIYTTPTCPWCRRTKDYLTQKGISFTEYNVAADREKAKEMIQISKQMGVPVVIIDGEVVVGFNQARLDSLLS
ncbi:MAG: glutaredoxin family protein [Dehalococcoidales bacterium]